MLRTDDDVQATINLEGLSTNILKDYEFSKLYNMWLQPQQKTYHANVFRVLRKINYGLKSDSESHSITISCVTEGC